MLNRITLIGRCGADPELRRTQSGLAVASVNLAVDRDYTPKDGGERETDWIPVVAWRGTAEFLCKYFTKGSMAVVSGRLQTRDWTDKDGNKRRAYEVLADNIYFGGSKTGEAKKADTVPPVAPGEFAELDGDDDNLPF